MRVLAIDIGSSSVKAAVLTSARPLKRIERHAFPTRYVGDRAEVAPNAILKAVRLAIAGLGDAVKGVDVVVPTGMAPSWLAMDANGRPLTPVVTHQDRRSQAQAEAIEREVGRCRHLRLAGNRPTPGGISSTTLRWFAERSDTPLRKAALVGNLNTWLIRLATGERVIDPSNVSFTGLYQTATLAGWSDELIASAKADPAWLPEVMDGNLIAGRVSISGARRLGLRQGTPMLAGVIDGSGGLIAAGATPGSVLNVIGSTDVLAVVTDRAKPTDGLLTRALGVGRRWVSVATVSAAGTAIAWANRTFFADLSERDFFKLVGRLTEARVPHAVSFDAVLAGSRTSVEATTATIRGLTLGTNRDDILAALLDSLARQSADRFARFDAAGIDYGRHALTTGGGDRTLAKLFRRNWPGEWTFERLEEATLAGAWALAESV